MRKARGKIVALVLMLLALILAFGVGITMSRRRAEIAAQRDQVRLTKRSGARPVLGVQVEEVKGAIVVGGVAPGGPAEAGGMKTGDVITRIGGRPVRGIEDVANAMQLVTTGDEVSILVDRNGSELSLPVVLGEPSPR